MVTLVVTRSSHDNALDSVVTMFMEFENLLYPKEALYLTQFQLDFTNFPLVSFKLIK